VASLTASKNSARNCSCFVRGDFRVFVNRRVKIRPAWTGKRVWPQVSGRRQHCITVHGTGDSGYTKEPVIRSNSCGLRHLRRRLGPIWKQLPVQVDFGRDRDLIDKLSRAQGKIVQTVTGPCFKDRLVGLLKKDSGRRQIWTRAIDFLSAGP